MMSHDFFVQMGYSQYLKTGGGGGQGWQPWMRWVHIAPIKGFNLFTNTCMQSRERKDIDILMQEETNFHTLRKIVTNFTNRYCPCPPGKMQCYNWLVPRTKFTKLFCERENKVFLEIN